MDQVSDIFLPRLMHVSSLNPIIVTTKITPSSENKEFNKHQKQHAAYIMTSLPPLGFIFDIDGTLIAEGDRVGGIRIRPGVISCLQKFRKRGHRLALWTAAHSAWAFRVKKKLCQTVYPDHDCTNSCSKTFDFCWSGDKMRAQKMGMASNPDWLYGCRWCQFYSTRCQRCLCFQYTYGCPCRSVKDLRKVWNTDDPETNGFVKERTVIVENTPQQCIYNYGNAIYVRTYNGYHTDDTFEAFCDFVIQELEPAPNVRSVRKCPHRPGPHACFEQSWWATNETEEKELVCYPTYSANLDTIV